MKIQIKAWGLEMKALTDGGEGAPSVTGRKPSKNYPSPVSVPSQTWNGAGYVAFPISDSSEVGPHCPGDFHSLGYDRGWSWFTAHRL